jgi:hypothetical protein
MSTSYCGYPATMSVILTRVSGWRCPRFLWVSLRRFFLKATIFAVRVWATI